MRKVELPFKIKKQRLNRNSEKDSRKSVLNQTHIVGHGKPEKSDFRHEEFHRYPCCRLQGKLSSCRGISDDGIKWQLKKQLVFARVKEKYQEAKARIIHDNRKQFISKDFKSLISLLELYETAARVCHPQSNGKLERFHSTLRTEHVRQTAYLGYEDAKEKMAQWIDFYNNERLHGALLYLTPEDYFEGRKESRLAE